MRLTLFDFIFFISTIIQYFALPIFICFICTKLSNSLNASWGVVFIPFVLWIVNNFVYFYMRRINNDRQ